MFAYTFYFIACFKVDMLNFYVYFQVLNIFCTIAFLCKLLEMVLISSTHIKQVDKSKQTIVIYQNKVYDVTKFVTIHPGNLILFTVCINLNIL